MTVKDGISKHFILTYLISKYGVAFKDRYKSNLLISYLSKDDLYAIPIPIFSKKIQDKIDDLFGGIFSKQKLSKLIYQEAEQLLLKELDLANWKPTNQNNNTKTFKESFETNGRFDAEYYQPKYDEMLAKLSSIKKDSLLTLVDIKKSIEPGSDAYTETGIPFVRVANLSKYEITQPDIHLPVDIVESPDTLFPRKDTILLSKDGTIGIAYKVEDDVPIITSGAILHLQLKTKTVLPDYLTLVLNSKVVQMQAERDSGGSIIQHWRIEQIYNIKIPILPMSIQNEIVQKVQESFRLRKQSKELLERAKRAVEIAIEQNEEEALKYLNDSHEQEM
ncbi:MAG: restriction endonuclease subunit S [Bacteriodetes bacterium]|nr:restriction endonuclease subunit S [Bacteroidota bacterium]